jgi:hypothetical protein
LKRFSIFNDLVFVSFWDEPLVSEGAFLGSLFHEFFEGVNILFSNLFDWYFFHLAKKFCPCTVQKFLGLFVKKSFLFFKKRFTVIHHISGSTVNRILFIFLAFLFVFLILMGPFSFFHSQSVTGTVLEFGIINYNLGELILIT